MKLIKLQDLKSILILPQSNSFAFTEMNSSEDYSMVQVNSWDCITFFYPLRDQIYKNLIGDVFLRKYQSTDDRVYFAKSTQ